MPYHVVLAPQKWLVIWSLPRERPVTFFAFEMVREERVESYDTFAEASYRADDVLRTWGGPGVGLSCEIVAARKVIASRPARD